MAKDIGRRLEALEVQRERSIARTNRRGLWDFVIIPVCQSQEEHDEAVRLALQAAGRKPGETVVLYQICETANPPKWKT